jgi:glutamate-1-semialdehyde 2,1-aminomutase
MNYQERLLNAIPGGAHTYSRGFDQFPSNAPQILAKGEGPYVWDPEGNRYLDYGMALRAVTLGYANQRVNAAAYKQIENGNNLTRASMIELEAAELMIDLIPSFEMLKFAKNGSNATTAAVKIARAYTGRRYVCVPRQQPFFSFDDWFIETTPMKKGIPDQNVSSTLMFDYGDITSLEKHFSEHPGEIATVILEPATTLIPCNNSCNTLLAFKTPCINCPNSSKNFLHQVQLLCNSEGALFVLDEMITGFRWHLQGAAVYFGVEPDLSTFGKGMANGFSVATVGGRREIMQVGATETLGKERTFLLSSTHGSEMSSLAAFVETANIYREHNVICHLWEYGKCLREGLIGVTKKLSMDDYFLMEGPDICLNYVLLDVNGSISLPLRTLFAQEMIRHGVLMPWIAISLVHGKTELEITLNAAEEALKVVSKALENNVENFLDGPVIKPVFRKNN